MQTHCLFPANWFVVRADRVSVDVCCHSLSPHPLLFVVITNLPPTLRLWGIHPRPAFYCDPNAPGLCGGLGMCLLQQDQLEREQQQAAGATKKHKMPSKSEKNRSRTKKAMTSRSFKAQLNKDIYFTLLKTSHKNVFTLFQQPHPHLGYAVRAAQMCWVQRFSAKSGLS